MFCQTGIMKAVCFSSLVWSRERLVAENILVKIVKKVYRAQKRVSSAKLWAHFDSSFISLSTEKPVKLLLFIYTLLRNQ